jgi:hypothetical protein
MRTHSSPVLRRLEITLHALLGRPFKVMWGSELSSDGETVWLPPEPLPFGAHLVRALQACTVATGPIPQGGAELGGWDEVLANLYAESRLRERFRGLGPAYEALRRASSSPTRDAGAGDRFLQLMVARTGAPLSEPSRRLIAAFASWHGAWTAWMRRPTRRWPMPPVPPPSRKLAFQASSRMLESQDADLVALHPAGPPAGPGSISVVIGVTPEGHRIVLPMSTQETSAVQREGTAGEAMAVETPPQGEQRSGSDVPAAWYDEWDSERHRYLPDWCAVIELGVLASADSVEVVSASAVRRVRRAFEHYRTANLWSRHEGEGPELDVEAAVQAMSEAGPGRLATERIFMSRRVRGPEAAVAVLMDLSDSISGMTLQIEKQALAMLAAALEAVGDTFALYCFRGRSRLRCEILRIKDFGDKYDSATARRIAAVRPSGYTRIAPALRHVTERLTQTSQRHKILLLVTDGMPFDVGGYGGSYAVEDTRQAWLEARARGVRPYCLNIDFTANQYLPRMCGPASWTVVSEPGRLPDALVSLYQRVRT